MPKNRKKRKEAYAVEEESVADGFNLEEFVGSPRGILYVVLLAVAITILTSPSLYTFLLGKVSESFHVVVSTAISVVRAIGFGANNGTYTVNLETPSTTTITTERFKAFNKAIELSAQKNYKNAIVWFETTNQTTDGPLPSNDLLHTEWGNAYYHLYKESIDLKNPGIDGIDMDSKYKQHLEKATGHYSRAIKINDKSFGALVNLAEIHMRHNRHLEQHDQNSTEYVKKLLDMLIDIRRECEPHRQVGKKIKLDPPPYCKDIKENKDEFSEAIRKVFVMKAELYFNEEKLLEAEAFLKQSAKIRPSNELYEKFGLVYEKLNKYKLAYTYYSKCKKDIPFCSERCAFMDKVGKTAMKKTLDSPSEKEKA